MSSMKKQLESIFEKIEESKWKESAKEWRANRDWLRYSQKIALTVLNRLDDLEWTQKDFAEAMSVSPQAVNKWLKGKENFTIETITRMEKVLKIKLISIQNPTVNYDFTTEQIPISEFRYTFYNNQVYKNSNNFCSAKVIKMIQKSYSECVNN